MIPAHKAFDLILSDLERTACGGLAGNAYYLLTHRIAEVRAALIRQPDGSEAESPGDELANAIQALRAAIAKNLAGRDYYLAASNLDAIAYAARTEQRAVPSFDNLAEASVARLRFVAQSYGLPLALPSKTPSHQSLQNRSALMKEGVAPQERSAKSDPRFLDEKRADFRSRAESPDHCSSLSAPARPKLQRWQPPPFVPKAFPKRRSAPAQAQWDFRPLRSAIVEGSVTSLTARPAKASPKTPLRIRRQHMITRPQQIRSR